VGGPDALVPRGRPWKAVALARAAGAGAGAEPPLAAGRHHEAEPAPDPGVADLLERKVGRQALELHDLHSVDVRHGTPVKRREHRPGPTAGLYFTLL